VRSCVTKWRDGAITGVTSVASIWHGNCELIETNVIKNNTHNIQPVNIYGNENNDLEKALISEFSASGFPTSPHTVSAPNMYFPFSVFIFVPFSFMYVPSCVFMYVPFSVFMDIPFSVCTVLCIYVCSIHCIYVCSVLCIYVCSIPFYVCTVFCILLCVFHWLYICIFPSLFSFMCVPFSVICVLFFL
jgi:hypothetical protein